jgi:flagellar biosynthetic protein FliQ
MDSAHIGDLFREALWVVLLVVLVMILPSLIVGLVVSTFQAATQINEQTLSFLPRLVVTLLVVIMVGPWLVHQVVEFSRQILMDIPYLIN